MTSGIEFAICPRCGREYQEGVAHTCMSSDVEAHRTWTLDARPTAAQILDELRAIRVALEELLNMQVNRVRR